MSITSIIIIACAALLVVYGVYHTIQKFRGKAKASCCGTAEMVTPKKVEDTDESHYPYRYTLSVEGMHCSNCARTVENTLNDMGDVWARVDLGHHRASVLSKSEKTESDFRSTLSKTSYTLAGLQASE